MKLAKKANQEQRIKAGLLRYRHSIVDARRLCSLYGVKDEDLVETHRKADDLLRLIDASLSGERVVRAKNRGKMLNWLNRVNKAVTQTLGEVREDSDETAKQLDFSRFTFPWVKL